MIEEKSKTKEVELEKIEEKKVEDYEAKVKEIEDMYKEKIKRL